MLSLHLGVGGLAATANQPTQFHSLITGATVLQSVQGDYGLAPASWGDMSGNAKHYTQSNADARPTLGALNGIPTAVFDGINDTMQSDLVLANPAVTPTWWCGVFRFLSYVDQAVLIGDVDTTNAMKIHAQSTAGQIRVNNGATPGNNGGAVSNAWVRAEAYFSASTSDYFLVAGTLQSGSSFGTLVPTVGRYLAFKKSGVYGNVEIAASMYCAGLPNQRAAAAGGTGAIDAAIAAKYAGLVAVA